MARNSLLVYNALKTQTITQTTTMVSHRQPGDHATRYWLGIL